jgi:Flp pilus assembly protein TadD
MDDYDQVLRTSPRDVEAVLGRVPLLIRHDRLDDAAAAAREAVALDPKSSDAWVALGDVLTRQRQFDEAAHAYAEARTLAPNAIEPVLGLARLCLFQEDRPGARTGYEAALLISATRTPSTPWLGSSGPTRRPRRTCSGCT